MRLVVDDRILQIYNALPAEFIFGDVLKLLGDENKNYHTIYSQIQT